MKVIQGFVVVPHLINNATGQTAPIGELSTYSRTFAKEKGEYRHGDYPEFQLVTFDTHDGDTSSLVSLTDPEVAEVFSTIRAMFAYANNTPRPFTLQAFQQEMEAQLGATHLNLVLGPLVEGVLSDFPQFVSFISRTNTNNEIKVWLSNEAFESQYTGFSITVIPPFEPITDFFGAYADVKLQIERTSMSVLGDRMQEAKLNHPETVSRLVSVKFVNRHSPTISTTVIFGVLVYGAEGDYNDAIKEAIVEYLVSHSTYNDEAWQTIFPDLFERTEFLFLPRWDLIALENLTERSSLHSSLLPIADSLLYARGFLSSMTPTHIEGHSHFLVSTYKLLSGVIVAGTNNAAGHQTFVQSFPDYIPVPTTSSDVARMTVRTQGMSEFLSKLLATAETATKHSALTKGTRRITRAGKLFVAKGYDGLNFLVAVKSNNVV